MRFRHPAVSFLEVMSEYMEDVLQPRSRHSWDVLKAWFEVAGQGDNSTETVADNDFGAKQDSSVAEQAVAAREANTDSTNKGDPNEGDGSTIAAQGSARPGVDGNPPPLEGTEDTAATGDASESDSKATPAGEEDATQTPEAVSCAPRSPSAVGGGWGVSECRVGKDGACGKCGEVLQSIELSEDDEQRLLKQVGCLVFVWFSSGGGGGRSGHCWARAANRTC